MSKYLEMIEATKKRMSDNGWDEAGFADGEWRCSVMQVRKPNSLSKTYRITFYHNGKRVSKAAAQAALG